MVDNLQDRFAPNSICFGCGPKNPAGLHLKSVRSGEALVAAWTPEPQHVAFSNFASGGIVSTLLDCHGNWAATYALMQSRKLSAPPGTVTAELNVRFLRPTPVDREWHLRAWPAKVDGDRVWVEETLQVEGIHTASMNGLFVAVKENHPAFHRWK
jgi:acyl-coenzyme A thioesterase PaaI-like protein